MDGEESSRLSGLSKLRLVAFPVEKQETLAMLLAALAPLSFRHSRDLSSHLPSSTLSCLAELNLTHMQLTPPAIQGLCQGLQQGAPWPALTTLSLEISHFSRTQDRTFRAYASPVLPLLQMLALPEMTPRFHTLRLGLLHTPSSRGGQEDNTALKSLCSGLRKLGPRLLSLDLSLPFMTKGAFTLLTTPSGGTMYHHFLPLRRNTNGGSPSFADSSEMKNKGEKQAVAGDDNSDEKEERKEEKKLSPILQPPDYLLLQRLHLMVPTRFEPESLALQKFIVGNCPSLEHLDLHFSLASRLLTQGLLRVLLQLQGLRSLRLHGGCPNSPSTAGVGYGKAKEGELEEKQAEAQTVMSLITEALAGGVWAARLCVLSLQRCDLCDAFLEKGLTPRALAGCPDLSTLNITENPAISQMGCAKLVQTLCVVKRAGLCPYLQHVDIGAAADERRDESYDVSPTLLKSVIHKALHPFG